MGRYRRGHKYQKRYDRSKHKPKNSDDNPLHVRGMGELELILVENYLAEYRSKAFDMVITRRHGDSQQQQQQQQEPIADTSVSVVIGRHQFPRLTTDLCKSPYLELPCTLSSKERRQIHALCSSLDLYHSGAGIKIKVDATANDHGNCNIVQEKRRVVISIYADGLEYVPDLEDPHHRKNCSSRVSSYRLYRPWYYRAHRVTQSESNSESGKVQMPIQPAKTSHSYEIKEILHDQQRNASHVHDIERHKKNIFQFVKYPEQSLRTALRRWSSEVDGSTVPAQEIDTLNLSELDLLDLSLVLPPKECQFMYVDSVEKLKQCVDELMYGIQPAPTNSSRVKLLHELAFDMEMYDRNNHRDTGSSYQPTSGILTCLIQLTSNVANKDYVIDPLALDVWDAIPIYLGPLFTDPQIVKIGHGIGGMDTASLHRDFGILVVNAFDTFEASAILSATKCGLGLAALCKHYGLPSWEEYQDLKKKYQRSNWWNRPLNKNAVEYGRYDIRCLILLRKLLIRDLVKADLMGGKIPLIHVENTNKNDEEVRIESQSAFVPRKGNNLMVHTSSDSMVTVGSSISEINVESHSFDTPFSITVNESFNGCSCSTVSDTQTDIESENDATSHAFKEMVESGESLNEYDSSHDVVCQGPSLSSLISAQIIRASDLPSFHRLMQAIKISHKRCLNLWTRTEESLFKNPSLLLMIEQAHLKKGYGKYWSDAHLTLYKELTNWRQRVANNEGIDETDVCTLDFLVSVAYKLPRNRWEMRRHSYFLPEILEESLPYFDELCKVVTMSEVYLLSTVSPLSEMERFEVVFYNRRRWKFTGLTTKVLIALTVVSVITLSIKVRKR